VRSHDDNEPDTALQQEIRNALIREGAYRRCAARIAELRGWAKTRDPARDAERWRQNLCKKLDGIGGRDISVSEYALIVEELGYSPIDFSRFAGGAA